MGGGLSPAGLTRAPAEVTSWASNIPEPCARGAVWRAGGPQPGSRSQAPHVALEAASRVSCGSVSTRARTHSFLAFWDPVLLATAVSWALWPMSLGCPVPKATRAPLAGTSTVARGFTSCVRGSGGARPPAVQGVSCMLQWHGAWAHGLRSWGSGPQPSRPRWAVSAAPSPRGQAPAPAAAGRGVGARPLLCSHMWRLGAGLTDSCPQASLAEILVQV